MTSINTPSRHRRSRAVISALAIAALAACGSGGKGSASGASGDGLPYTATKEEWVKAFENVDPITLNMTGSSPESFGSRSLVDYAKELEEYSGGKIKTEISWAYAIAGPIDLDDALVDGRLDVAVTFPLYEPQLYPTNDALVSLSHHRTNTPVVGELASWAAMSEAAWASDSLKAEYDKKGVVILDAFHNRDSAAIACKQPVKSMADLKGKQVRVSGVVHNKQIAGLGATPVSLLFNEVYEALQRGVVDCALGGLATMSGSGWLEVAPHVMLDTDAGFSTTPGAYHVGSNFKDMPLLAQQLIFDRQTTYVKWNILSDWNSIVDDNAQIAKYKGSWTKLDDAGRTALKKVNEDIDADIASKKHLGGKGLVDSVVKTHSDWDKVVRDLGYTDEADYDGFDEWYKGVDTVDLTPFLAKYYEKVLLPHRPS